MARRQPLVNTSDRCPLAAAIASLPPPPPSPSTPHATCRGDPEGQRPVPFFVGVDFVYEAEGRARIIGLSSTSELPWRCRPGWRFFVHSLVEDSAAVPCDGKQPAPKRYSAACHWWRLRV